MLAKTEAMVGMVLLLTLPGLLFAAESGGPAVVSDVPYIVEGHELQTLDIYHVPGELRPVIVYVHGGGWAFGDKADVSVKPGFFLDQGMALVSMNYRLRWDFPVLSQLEDIASVIVWVRENGEAFGLDPQRISLMGNAAGAHLVSVVATNPRILRAEDLSLSDISSVIAIDTGSYDIPRVMSSANFIERRQHRLIFGNDERSWEEYSPAFHVGPDREIPPFVIVYGENKEPDNWQAQAFASSLTEAGVDAILIPTGDRARQDIDGAIGQSGDVATQAILTFLRANF